MKKVLITGGMGFIGTHLSEKLADAGYDIHIFDRVRATRDKYYRGDLNDYYSLENAFDKARPDIVIHLAGMVSRKECEETALMAISTNGSGTFNVCSLSLKHKARLIYAGSSEEYGSVFVNNHEAVDENTPFKEPTSIYSVTKRMAEEIVQYFSCNKCLEATTMRLFMLYGPGEELTDYRSAITRFTYWALKNKPLFVHRDTERSWCHIDDAMKAMQLIIERKQSENYEVINIGNSKDSIKTNILAEKIVQSCNSSSSIKMIEAEPTVIPIKRASFEKAKKVLGWEPKILLDAGLKEVIEDVKKRIQ